MPYEIADYDKLYRPYNKSGEELKYADWVKLPVNPKGDGLQVLLEYRRGLEVFGVWCLLLEKATDEDPENRGKLVNHKGEAATIPEIAKSISLKGKERLVEYALTVLTAMGWVHSDEQGEQSSVQAEQIPTKSSVIKSSKIKSNIDFENFLDYWNSKKPLPSAMFTSGRLKKYNTRIGERAFTENWRVAVDALAASKFHTGENERGWKADIDWFLKNDTNYVKMIERARMQGRERRAEKTKQENLAAKQAERKKREQIGQISDWAKEQTIGELLAYLKTNPSYREALCEIRPEIKNKLGVPK